MRCTANLKPLVRDIQIIFRVFRILGESEIVVAAMLTELRNRGPADALIACWDGRTPFLESPAELCKVVCATNATDSPTARRKTGPT